MSRVQPGDAIVVAFLHRFSRNFEEGVRIHAELAGRNIDTSERRRGQVLPPFHGKGPTRWTRPANGSGVGRTDPEGGREAHQTAISADPGTGGGWPAKALADLPGWVLLIGPFPYARTPGG